MRVLIVGGGIAGLTLRRSCGDRVAGRWSSGALAWGRDQLVRRLSATRFLNDIINSMREPF